MQSQSLSCVIIVTYDLHGSWDSPEDDIGSYIYAHTNLTEISEALDLLWRNDVPANKVNMGLGFYGSVIAVTICSLSLPSNLQSASYVRRY